MEVVEVGMAAMVAVASREPVVVSLAAAAAAVAETAMVTSALAPRRRNRTPGNSARDMVAQVSYQALKDCCVRE